MGPELGHLLDSLGWAILHSLWQGSLAAIAVILFRNLTKDKQASLRYGFQVLCLCASFTAFIVTFSIYHLQSATNMATSFNGNVTFEAMTALIIKSSSQALSGDNVDLFERLKLYMPLLGMLWCGGFVLMAARYCGAFIITQRLRSTGLSAAPSRWDARFRTLVRNAGIRRNVQIFVSNRVSGPLTLGFFKPIVLVPASFFANLPAQQIEAILLHEIAHIRRHDYLINLFQTAIRTVFFFHPAIHYVSRKIDEDREHACDDFAVSFTRDPQSLARGLAALRLNTAMTSFTLAADNGNTPLVARLRRLGNMNDTRRRPEHVISSVATLMLAAGFYITASPFADAKAPATTDEKPIEELAGPAPFSPPNSPAPFVSPPPAPLAAAPEQMSAEINKNIQDTMAETQRSLAKVWQTTAEAANELGGSPIEDLAGPAPAAAVPPLAPGIYQDGEFVAGTEFIDQNDVDIWAQRFQNEIQRIVAERIAGRMSADAAEDAIDRAEDELDAKIDRALDLRDKALEKADAERERALEKAEAEREKALSRAEAERERALEKAELKRERELERALERSERELDRAMEQADQAREQAELARKELEASHPEHLEYQGFNDAMLKQLKADGLIDPKAMSATITYPNKKMTVNGVAVPRDKEGNYCEFLEAYGLKKTDQTKITIGTHSFKFQSSSDNGRSITRIEHNFEQDNKGSSTPTSPKTPSQPTTYKSGWMPSSPNSGLMTDVSFINPTPDSRLSQKYGALSVTGKFHNGIDLAAPQLTPIVASAPGTVTYAKNKGEYGNLVYIVHADGYETHYAHLHDINVKEGEQVSKGSLIGTVGSTGKSTGPHLHFEIIKDGKNINPENFISST